MSDKKKERPPPVADGPVPDYDNWETADRGIPPGMVRQTPPPKRERQSRGGRRPSRGGGS